MKMRMGAPIGWILVNSMGMKSPTERVSFEQEVIVDGNTKRIDVYIPETHVLIEQAGKGLPELPIIFSLESSESQIARAAKR